MVDFTLEVIMKLTKTVIDNLKYNGEGNKPRIIFDDEVRGFAIRVYPSGAKSFLIDYRLNGIQRRMVLGKYGILTLDQARKEARKKLVEVLSGTDPLEDKIQKRKGEKIKDLCSTYLEEYSKKKKRSWQEDQRKMNRRILPQWGEKRVKDLKLKDVQTLHREIGEKHPYEANRVLALLSSMFEWGRKNGFQMPEDNPNPARGIDRYKEEKRDKWVKHHELPKLAEAIDSHENCLVKKICG
jgi:hypothetical protein